VRANARLRGAIVLALLVLFVPPGGAETGTHATREVHRGVASPLAPLDDSASWRIEVPPGEVVCVDARSTMGALFSLSWEGPEPGATLPGVALAHVFPEGVWTLTLDPVAGIDASFLVDFHGAFVACDNAPAPFTITDLPERAACVTEAGFCLP